MVEMMTYKMANYPHMEGIHSIPQKMLRTFEGPFFGPQESIQVKLPLK